MQCILVNLVLIIMNPSVLNKIATIKYILSAINFMPHYYYSAI